ncbi:MAG: hypothetical protein MHM6MM_002387 [Cercozoa sp. M6MM]
MSEFVLGVRRQKASARTVTRWLEQVCEKRGIQVSHVSGGMVSTLTLNGRVRHVIGHSFPLNNATSAKIASDKVASTAVLTAAGIACVPHYLLVSDTHPWSDGSSLGQQLAQLMPLGTCKVVKPKRGSGGNNVFLCHNDHEAYQAAFSLMQKHGDVTVSPFVDAELEIRAIVLNGKTRVTFAKQRPCVVGDGKHCASTLVKNLLGYDTDETVIKQALEYAKLKAATVLEKGVKRRIDFRHNLCRGATARTQLPDSLRSLAEHFAERVAKALDINFCSVDILRTLDDTATPSLTCMEVNPGVCMTRFVRQYPEHLQLALDIMDEAVCSLFDLPFSFAGSSSASTSDS